MISTFHFKTCGQIARAVLLALAAIALTSPSEAHDYRIGDIRIIHPWTRATPPGAQAAGGYLQIENIGTTPDRLIGGSLPGAGKVEIHEMALSGGVMRMRELEKGLMIAPGQTIALKPGSFHIMFVGLEAPFTTGVPIKGILVFEKAGRIEVEYKVEPIGAKSSSEEADHSGHHGHGAAPASGARKP